MQHPSASERLSMREYIGYALGDTASNLFFQTFNIFLTYYYVDVWGLPAAALLIMMPLVRFTDAVGVSVVCVTKRLCWKRCRCARNLTKRCCA